jgi:hypothetical protein
MLTFGNGRERVLLVTHSLFRSAQNHKKKLLSKFNN